MNILLCNCLHLYRSKKAVAGAEKPFKNASSPPRPLDPLAEDKRGHPDSIQAALHQRQCSRTCVFKVSTYLLKFDLSLLLHLLVHYRCGLLRPWWYHLTLNQSQQEVCLFGTWTV